MFLASLLLNEEPVIDSKDDSLVYIRALLYIKNKIKALITRSLTSGTGITLLFTINYIFILFTIISSLSLGL